MSKPAGAPLAMATQKRCANPACTTAQSNKDTPMWRKGWIDDSGDHVALCNPCGLLYSRGWFCNWCHGVYRRIDKPASGDAKAIEYWLPCDYCPNWVHLQCEKTNAADCLSDQHFACYSCRDLPAAQRRLQRNVTLIPAASGCQATEIKDGLRSAYSRPFLHPDVAPARRVTSAAAPTRSAGVEAAAPPTNSNKRGRQPRATAVDSAHVMQAMGAESDEEEDEDERPSAPSRGQARPAAGKQAARSGGAKRRRVTISRKAAEAAEAEAAFLLAQQRQVHVRARASLSAYSTPAVGNHRVSRLFKPETPMTGTPGLGSLGGPFGSNTHRGLQTCATTARFVHSPLPEVTAQAEHLLAGDAGASAQAKGNALTLYAGALLRRTSTPERARAACAVDAVRKRTRGRLATPDGGGGAGPEALQAALQTAASKSAALASAPTHSTIVLKPTPVRLSRPRSAMGVMGLGPRQIHDDPAMVTPPSLGCAKCRYSATGCRACRSEGAGHIDVAAGQQPRTTKARKPRGGQAPAPALPSGGNEWDLHSIASPFYAGLVSSVDGPDDVLVAQPGLALWREQSSPSMAALAAGSTPFFTNMALHSPGGGAAMMGSPGGGLQLFRHSMSPMSGMGSPLGSSLFGGTRSAFIATSPRGPGAMAGLWGISPPSPVMSPTAMGAGTGGSWVRRLGADDPMG